MSYKNFLALVMVGLLSAGCASVPPESVELSKALGKGLSNARDAHVATLNAFYENRKESNDKWVADTYLSGVFGRYKQGLLEGCKRKNDTSRTCAELTDDDHKRLMKDVIEFRDGLQSTLEKSKQDSVELIDAHYASLLMGNSAITGLLTSVVDLKKSTKDAATSVGSSLGINIDTDKISKSFDEFLLKAGNAGAKLQELRDSLKKAMPKQP
jgi:hypothetical protein